MKLLPEVMSMTGNELMKYALARAKMIAKDTPGDSDSWDDPESWQAEAVELAHAIVRLSEVADTGVFQ
jgi:hypothetical protein